LTQAETRLAFEQALERAQKASDDGKYPAARKLFWEAHQIGRPQTSLHVRGHIAMLRFALRRKDYSDSLTQAGLTVFALLLTWVRPEMPPPRSIQGPAPSIQKD
jgi:hypothetical protein